MKAGRQLPPDGTIVRAKRLGWDEVLTPEQEIDLEPYADKGYASDDLEGEIVVSPYDADAVLVDGQEADPKTVTVVDSPRPGAAS